MPLPMFRLKTNPQRFVMFLFEEPQPHSEPLIVYYDMRDRERNKRGKTEFNRKFEKVR
jgi:hypothetical protein